MQGLWFETAFREKHEVGDTRVSNAFQGYIKSQKGQCMPPRLSSSESMLPACIEARREGLTTFMPSSALSALSLDVSQAKSQQG